MKSPYVLYAQTIIFATPAQKERNLTVLVIGEKSILFIFLETLFREEIFMAMYRCFDERSNPEERIKNPGKKTMRIYKKKFSYFATH